MLVDLGEAQRLAKLLEAFSASSPFLFLVKTARQGFMVPVHACAYAHLSAHVCIAVPLACVGPMRSHLQRKIKDFVFQIADDGDHAAMHTIVAYSLHACTYTHLLMDPTPATPAAPPIFTCST